MTLQSLKNTAPYRFAVRVYYSSYYWALSARSSLPRLGIWRSALDLNAIYDRELLKVMQLSLCPDSTCIDVGANVGLILENMFRVSPEGRHFAFEPIPALADSLATTYPSARVQACALSDQTAILPFNHLTNGEAESSLKLTKTHTKNPIYEIIQVPVKRLDDVIPQDARISLIKIDTEGCELPVIRGGVETIRRCKPLVIFETGRNTTPFHGVGPDDIYTTITETLGMNLSTMSRWLKRSQPYDRDGFRKNFESGREYYFIAYP